LRRRKIKGRGFVVHCYADPRKDRLYLVGRLEDGRSFAAVDGKWRPSLHIFERDGDRARNALSSVKYEAGSPTLESFDGREKLLRLVFFRHRDYNDARSRLEQAAIPSPNGDLKPPDAYFILNHIKGSVELDGGTRLGRFVDLVFPDPQISPTDESKVSLKVASIDIETDVDDGTILAAAMSLGGTGLVRVLAEAPDDPGEGVFFHPSETSLLSAFLQDIRKADPDVLTGWNFLDFDFPQLAQRCAFHRLPFAISRSGDEAKFFRP